MMPPCMVGMVIRRSAQESFRGLPQGASTDIECDDTKLRVFVDGSSVKCKVWNGDGEPAEWVLGKSDERISESGAVGFGAVTESGSFLTMRHVQLTM